MKNMGKMGWLLGMSPMQAFLKFLVTQTVAGPSKEERDAERMCLWGQVSNEKGDAVAMTMETPEGYNLTVDASINAVQKLIEKAPHPGAYTPSLAFGADFVTELEGVTVENVDPVEL